MNKPPYDQDLETPDYVASSKSGRVTRAATRLGVSGVAGLVGMAGGSMVATQDLNPVTAVDKNIDGIRFNLFRADFCSSSPSEAERENLENIVSASIDLYEATERAEQAGMTFVDAIELLSTHEALTAAASPEDATDLVNDYTSNNFGFNFSLSFPNGNEKLFNEQAYVDSLKKFVTYTSLFPREFLRELDIDKLIASNLQQITTDHIGEYDSRTNIVEIDLNILGEPSTFIHEVVGHAVHDTACNGYLGRDHAFTEHNPEGFEYNEQGGENRSSYADFQIVMTNYGATNNAEDYAEIAQAYMLGNYEHWSGSESPLNEKFYIMLDRINEVTPGALEYLDAARDIFGILDRMGGSSEMVYLEPGTLKLNSAIG